MYPHCSAAPRICTTEADALSSASVSTPWVGALVSGAISWRTSGIVPDASTSLRIFSIPLRRPSGVFSTIHERVFELFNAALNCGRGTVRIVSVKTTSTSAQAATLSTPPKKRSTPLSGVISVTRRRLRPPMSPNHCPSVRQRIRIPIAVISPHLDPTAATASGMSHAAAHTPRARPIKVPSVVKKPLRRPAMK